MNGIHIIAEFYACAADVPSLHQASALAELCQASCREAGLEVVGQCFHQFGDAAHPAGATGTIVLAESHLAIHTWPELAAVTLDLYVCNFSRNNQMRAEAAYTCLLQAFKPGRVERQTLSRGALRVPETTP